MKKIFYLFAITAFVFTSCNPLEDVNTEVDALTSRDGLIDDFVYTLVDDDYTEVLDLNCPNLSGTDEAKELLPAFLSSKYPALGVTYKTDGKIDRSSSALVTYGIFSPKRTERSLTLYEVTSADYAAAGLGFGNFDNVSQINDFLDTKYPSAANRMLVNLTYKWYNGASTVTLENGFIIVNGNWEMSTGITADEYTSMGQNRAQFNNEDEALAKIPVFLKNKFQYENKVAGDIEGIMYKLYVEDTQDIDNDGRTNDKTVYSFLAYFIYDGSTWSEYNNILSESLQFGHDGTTWVPDNTIKYTLTSADIQYISNAFITIYPGPADNVGFFGSFDRRESSSNYWSDDMLLEAFNTLLNNINPSSEEGQKYALTYVIYDGATGNNTINLIKEGGVWRVN
jgi:hypothetical protein